MKKIMLVFAVMLMLVMVSSCLQRQVYAPDPPEAWSYKSISNPADNKNFTVSITPAYWSSYRQGYGWHAFDLSVVNKTNKNIEIVWDKTLFISDGSTRGRFMFEGVVYKERNDPKPNDVVFANSTFTRLILPCALVEYMSAISIGGRIQYPAKWFHHIIPPGETGAYITVKVDNNEISEKVLINIRKE